MKKEYFVTCPFCAVGCRFKIRKGMDEVVFSSRTLDEIDFDYDNPVSGGALCPRGHFAYELLSHPKRLGKAYYRYNGKHSPEIPEIIFQKIGQEIKKRKAKNPLAILIDPPLSLHDIRAILDFAQDNGIFAVDFVAPTDRHLFRALLDNPFSYQKCHDARILKELNHILCVGDVFSKQPVLSRYLLKSKYAFRSNRLFTINPIPTRTSWFSNLHIEHKPHYEPILLFYLFQLIFQKKSGEEVSDDLNWLHQFIKQNLSDVFKEQLSDPQKEALNTIAEALITSQNSAIFFSTHLYNAAGSYLSSLACAAISSLTNSYFMPLYTDSNLSAIEEYARNIFQKLELGKRAVLSHILQNQYQYIVAIGWNPESAFPGQIQWPDQSEWVITSMIQTDFPENTRAILPQAHFYEQMDLRTNFLVYQSQGSEKVKEPVGSSQPISQFIYQFYQKITEQKVNLKQDSQSIPGDERSYREKLEAELNYYQDRLHKLDDEKGYWMVPTDHVAHYKDGELTRLSSWVQKICTDQELMMPAAIAGQLGIKDGNYLSVEHQGQKILFKAQWRKSLPESVVIPNAHYPSVRKMMEAEFAEHNREYYFFCPHIVIKKQ